MSNPLLHTTLPTLPNKFKVLCRTVKQCMITGVAAPADFIR
ncbi:hypothetical protein J2S09_003369 [Bacillus fengqiuensis]|nr:hypothetical protein [Bacillus fengqiuensis]